MEAGKLRHLVTIIRNTVLSKDEYGQEVTVPEAFALIYASIRPLSEREFFQAREIHADVTHVIKMRRIPGVTAKMWISHEGRIFQFLGPPLDLNERHIEIEILAMERTSKTPDAADVTPVVPMENLLGNYNASLIANVDASTDLGDVVLLRDDLSQFGNDFTQGTPALVSVYRTGIQNGLNVIRFDGSDNLIQRTDDSDFEVNDFSLFGAIGRIGTGDELFVTHQSNITPGSLRGFGLDIQGGLLRCFISIDSSNWHSTTSLVGMPIGWHLISAIKSGQTVTLYIDGQQVGQKTDAPASINFAGTPKVNAIGAHPTSPPTLPYDGDFGQYTIYGIGVDDSRRDLVHNLFSDEWGISI